MRPLLQFAVLCAAVGGAGAVIISLAFTFQIAGEMWGTSHNFAIGWTIWGLFWTAFWLGKTAQWIEKPLTELRALNRVRHP